MQHIAYRLTSMLCDGIVANSHARAEFARRLHRLPQDKVRVVWNGIDLQEVDARLASSRQPAGQIFPGSDLKRLCMVRSIQPGKDYPLALRVVLEAMACGTPFVTTDYSDVRRILPFSEQVVSSRAAPEIAAAVVRCYRRRDGARGDAEPLGGAARNRIGKRGCSSRGLRKLCGLASPSATRAATCWHVV